MTRSVCNSASATLELLTRDLDSGERAEFRDRSGVHMTLHVSRLADCAAGSLFSIAHAHAGHLGELVPDPLVTLLRGLDGAWTPTEISTPFAHVVTAEVGDTVRVVLRDEHRQLVKLTEVWTRNVRFNLLRSAHAFRKEEMCSPAEYQTA
ncbi:MAG: hypothetical protein ABI488_05755 [Polyangiaceae bacterium]